MGMAFNLKNIKGVAGNGLLSEASKKLAQKNMSVEYIPIDAIELNSNNFYSIDGIDELANLIQLYGLEQPLVVTHKDGEHYLLMTGERRITAIKKLRANGDWGDLVPCIVKDMDDINLPLSDEKKMKLGIMVTNQTRDKTEADIANEIREWKEIYTELRKKGVECISLGKTSEGEEITQEIKGKKTRELIADQLGISNGQVAKYEAVEKRGSKELKEKFQKNKVPVAVAEKIAVLPEKEQKEFMDSIAEEENITIHKLKEFIVEKEMQTPETNLAEIQAAVKKGQSEDECEQKVPVEEENTLTSQRENFSCLKNDSERKNFLRNYKEWPVWFQVPEAAEIYYRYDLPDKFSIVIREYHYYVEWMEKEKNMNPEQVGKKFYLLYPDYKYLYDCISNETLILKHLVKMQK